MKPQEYWKKSKTSEEWIRRSRFYRRNQKDPLKSFLKEFSRKANEFETILEVGAGDGRLIGALSEKHKKKDCNSVDINSELSMYVSEKYKRVNTYCGDMTVKLPFEDNSFDIVYTYQVVQHIAPEDIENVLKELKRVARKEMWMFEGWGNLKKWGLPNGHIRHGGDGGTFYWDIDKLIKCYEAKMFSIAKPNETGIKLYKVKV